MWFAHGVNSLTGQHLRRFPLSDERRADAMAALKRVLVVETEPGFRRLLEQVAGPISSVHAVADFQSARNALMGERHDLLLTNIRLGAHNGLHLIYLARSAGLQIRPLAYSDPVDAVLAREAQRAGGFYEPLVRLPYSLVSYIQAELPVEDRRNPAVVDRRAVYRGGRRRSDVPLSGAGLAWT